MIRKTIIGGVVAVKAASSHFVIEKAAFSHLQIWEAASSHLTLKNMRLGKLDK
jgi:hypothetical protein